MLFEWIIDGVGDLKAKTLDPVVHVSVYEFILALRLDHVVSLFAETAHHAENREPGLLGEGIPRPMDVLVHGQHYLLQVVDGGEGARPSDPRGAVQDYFVVSGYVRQLLGVEKVLAASLAPMVQT